MGVPSNASATSKRTGTTKEEEKKEKIRSREEDRPAERAIWSDETRSELVTCRRSDRILDRRFSSIEKKRLKLVGNIEVIECDVLPVEKRCHLNSKAMAVQVSHFLIRSSEINHRTQMLLIIHD